MVRRGTYFVSLNKNTITKVSVPDTVEYEIIATYEEVTELKRLINEYNRSNSWITLNNLFFNPLEADDDNVQKKENDSLLRVYEFIHRHGTERTKEKIESLNLIQLAY